MEERQPQWDATQERILDAADALIARRGVRGVTIAELARRAELSRPTIYRSWSDADDVVRASLLRRVARILATFPASPGSRSELVDDVLLLDQVFDREVRMILNDLGASRVCVLRANIFELRTNDAQQPFRPGEDVAEILNLREQLLELLPDLVLLEPG